MDQHSVETKERRSKRIVVWGVMGLIVAILALMVGILTIRTDGSSSLSGSTTAEGRKMAAAVQAFQTQYKVTHIPSRIKLCKFVCQYDLSNQFDQDSLAYLNQVWPRTRWSAPEPGSDQTTYFRIDWDGIEGPGPDRLVLNKGEKPPTGPAPVILEGDQCLVFFLGGIPVSQGGVAGSNGFSQNPTNPASPKGERVAPFYEFKSNRLVKLHGNAFYSYLDPYGEQPFAYFSAHGKRNDYNRYFSLLGNSDCARLGVWPYALTLGPPSQYVNPDTFQIISAGADGKFGPGTVLPDGKTWSPAKAKQIDAAGRDDMSNFHSLLLGTPGN